LLDVEAFQPRKRAPHFSAGEAGRPLAVKVGGEDIIECAPKPPRQERMPHRESVGDPGMCCVILELRFQRRVEAPIV
jgi:hypothetical protein